MKETARFVQKSRPLYRHSRDALGHVFKKENSRVLWTERFRYNWDALSMTLFLAIELAKLSDIRLIYSCSLACTCIHVIPTKDAPIHQLPNKSKSCMEG